MTHLKKTAVAVKAAVAALALGSSVAFAGTMGPVCTATPVTVPCETFAWDFGGKALYLQSLYTGAFGYESSTFDPAGSRLHSNNRWGWGFMIEGSSHFGTGNDVNVNWYHFSKDHNRNNVFFTDTPTIFGITALEAHTIRPQWDAVNVEFGQHVDFGEFKDIRFHAGGQFAQIKHRTYGYVNDANNRRTFEKFEGFGGRVGADMNYGFGNGVAIYGNAAAAVLVGTSKFGSFTTIGGVASTNPLFTNYGSRNALVPELETKLGATYTYGMPQGNLILDVGYLWVNYFNALNRAIITSDFGVDGVQFGLKYIGAV